MAKSNIITQQPAREPLEAVQNNAKRTPRALSPALKSAINTLSESRIRKELENLLAHFDAPREYLEKKILVRGLEVSRYCGDPEYHEEVGTEDEDGEPRKVHRRHSQYPKGNPPIAIPDDEWTSRFSMCENCQEEFDVSDNDGRDCTWHKGEKGTDYDADCWADHDPDCHGPFEDWDDSDHREGFIWDCCKAYGDDIGCMNTNHKSRINIPKIGEYTTKKRKAGEEIERPATYARIV